MRWILVFIILYLTPIIVLFKNYKSFRRACIYGSLYITLVTTIVITNIYLSGLKVIEETLDYEDNIALETYVNKDSYDKINEKVTDELDSRETYKSNNKIVNNEEKSDIDNKKNSKVSNEKESSNIVLEKASREIDLEKIYKFKKNIYSIERIALVPMRECLPYTNNLQKSISNLGEVKEDVVYAKEMCEDIVNIYDKMDVPNLSKKEYNYSLEKARLNVKKTYEFRTLAMENSLKLIETKNPMYINKITNYLKMSDKEINKFKEEIKKLKENINNN